MSEGEYVSMGYFEQYDLKAVVEYLNTIKYINKWLILIIFLKKINKNK